MPESPEVEALARFLSARLGGREVAAVELASVAALKTFRPPIDALVGRTVEGVERRGKMVAVRTVGSGPPLWLVVHLARGGWIRFKEELAPGRPRPGKGPLALRVRLAGGGGFEVTEAGTEKHLAIWVCERPEELEQVARLGPDPLQPGFDLERLSAALAGAKAILKGALTDQRVLAGVGNAYSDEVLHVARLSPFKGAGKLSPDELGRLHRALVDVLEDAAARSDGLSAGELKGEKRSGMRVHGRSGEPCPVCGEPVRTVWFASSSLQYCARCQTGGKVLADRRLSRLLK
jgi:formamidopyrimidine-DNA glycosylase